MFGELPEQRSKIREACREDTHGGFDNGPYRWLDQGNYRCQLASDLFIRQVLTCKVLVRIIKFQHCYKTNNVKDNCPAL